MERTVALVEDDDFTRTLLREVLEAAGFAVTEARTAAEAMRIVDRDDPDALIVDVDLGIGPTGLDLLGALGDRLPGFGVLVLTNYPSTTGMVAGVPLPEGVGHLAKRDITKPGAVAAAIEAVLRDQPPRTAGSAPELAHLTAGQLRLLRLIALGMSNEAIAQERKVTVRSVESMVSRLFAALGLGSDPDVNARVRAAMLYAGAIGIPRGGQT